MTQIYDLFSETDFREQVTMGNITVRMHPEFPTLAIANYTDQVAFTRDWNPVTTVCRGLIWDISTHQVLARPFPKFFNWDEKEAPRILDDQIVWHYDNKFDGSLGIVYPTEDGLRMATRGSFASDQAKLGSKLLLDLSEGDYDRVHGWLDAGYTPLFEICGPDNRIVLRYDENFLAPLGYIHIESGEFIPPSSAGMGKTMRELLGDLSRDNSEGWVVWVSNRKPLKIKQADYIELHRLVSNLTEKEVWRQLRAGTYSKYVEALPDELYKLAEEWATGLRQAFVKTYNQADVYYSKVRYGGHGSRKSQALWIQANVESEFRGLVFMHLDGKDITDSVWRMLEPRG